MGLLIMIPLFLYDTWGRQYGPEFSYENNQYKVNKIKNKHLKLLLKWRSHIASCGQSCIHQFYSPYRAQFHLKFQLRSITTSTQFGLSYAHSTYQVLPSTFCQVFDAVILVSGPQMAKFSFVQKINGEYNFRMKLYNFMVTCNRVHEIWVVLSDRL